MNITTTSNGTTDEYFFDGGREAVIARLEKDLTEELAYDVKPSEELVAAMQHCIDVVKGGGRYNEYYLGLVDTLIQLGREKKEFILSRRADIEKMFRFDVFGKAGTHCYQMLDDPKRGRELDAVLDHLRNLLNT